MARRLVHDAGACGIQRKRYGGRAVHDDRDPQDLQCGERLRQARERREEYGQDRADRRRELEADELQDVVVQRAALSHRADDGGEVVVGQHHGGGLLGHRRAADAHRHADVGLLQRRRIVDAVPGHRHDVPLGLQRAHDLHLVRGRHAGEHGDLVDRRGQLRCVHAVEFRA